MKLTFEEAIENHRKMWNWIADETEKRRELVNKSDYFEENDIIMCHLFCFCCQYAKDNSDATRLGVEIRDCKICPIDWGVQVDDYDKHQCIKHNTPYDWWVEANSFEEWKFAAKYARQIANLPVRREQINC